jgi:hypothetical protein
MSLFQSAFVTPINLASTFRHLERFLSSFHDANYKAKPKVTFITSGIFTTVVCETWSLTFREERRLRVFENTVLRRLFGPKRDEVTGNGESCITRS